MCSIFSPGLLYMDTMHDCPSKIKRLETVFKSRTGSDVTYSCYHNSTRSYFALICAFVVSLSLSFVTISHIAYVLIEDTNSFA
jgi:hypothetical protein